MLLKQEEFTAVKYMPIFFFPPGLPCLVCQSVPSTICKGLLAYPDKSSLYIPSRWTGSRVAGCSPRTLERLPGTGSFSERAWPKEELKLIYRQISVWGGEKDNDERPHTN